MLVVDSRSLRVRVRLTIVHFSAATVADVQLLILNYHRDLGFMNKLLSALDYHFAADRISDADKEAIFAHILYIGQGFKQLRSAFKTSPHLLLFSASYMDAL
ncbi:hypothetical protein DPSP01_006523 [Paraphaeosphaeria sporulosa]